MNMVRQTKDFLRSLKLQFEPDIEKAFLIEDHNSSIGTARIGFVLGLLLFPLFGILDQYMLPETKNIAWFIRFYILVPSLLLVFLASFADSFRQVFAPAICVLSIVLGSGVLMMIYFAEETEPGYLSYYTGLILIIFYIGTFSQMPFKYAVYAILFISTAHFAISIFKQDMVAGGFSNSLFPTFMNNTFFLITASIVALFCSFTFEKYKRNTFIQHRVIEDEKNRSEQLLLNILPPRVASDLKKTGYSSPKVYNNVTVLFSDIVGFTSSASSIEPQILINALNELFTAFDMIMQKHNCERIKTIGDAYLAVSGMPDENEDHASNMVKAAKKIILYAEHRNETHPIKWQIRIGIHTGKVVGGIVGVKKYIYDVFGDTINVASRMETSCDPMKINISGSTFKLIEKEFECKARGHIMVKGKGEMNMYYLQ
ncbi:MAG: adenylate/guanylate cyclase domain-containing protein [Flavobacteriales bacterium]|nr:adenylate/guanylate cyclase domain-containing protein [Flavobacteriales bacterium]